jgi:hypothetical protein
VRFKVKKNIYPCGTFLTLTPVRFQILALPQTTIMKSVGFGAVQLRIQIKRGDLAWFLV